MQNYAVDDTNYIDDPFVEEMIDGKIYLMARPDSRHLIIQRNLSEIFRDYFKKNKRKCTAISEMQIYIDEYNYVEPDVLIYCIDNNKKKDRRIPVIIIEVLSPSTWKKDVTSKMQKYAEIGIEEYWTIDYLAKRINIYKLNGDKYDFHESYYFFSEEDFSIVPKIRAKEEGEFIKEFSPISFPEMTILLEDVFNLEDLELI